MGAKTRTVVVLAVLGKIAFVGAAIGAPMTSASPDGHAPFDDPILAQGFPTLTDIEPAPHVRFAAPSPVPLPTSLALIGSSLLVLALVGATL